MTDPQREQTRRDAETRGRRVTDDGEVYHTVPSWDEVHALLVDLDALNEALNRGNLDGETPEIRAWCGAVIANLESHARFDRLPKPEDGYTGWKS